VDDSADLAAKIQAMLEDPERLGRMGRAGRAMVEERYLWPRVVEKMGRSLEGAGR
jgi:glycosyltransferase involved in cell wall biosynthesis